MIERRLVHAEGFDPATQAVVSYAFAELEDQSRLLRESTAGLAPEDFAWQPAPGFNSIGMLVAHCAIAEYYWLSIAAAGIPFDPDGPALCRRVLGIGPDDDGIPCPPGGGHPEALAGWTAEQYFGLLARAREASRQVLAGWTDASLAESYAGSRGPITREWTLYHVVEHLAQHTGQVGLLKRLRAAAGG